MKSNQERKLYFIQFFQVIKEKCCTSQRIVEEKEKWKYLYWYDYK